MRNLVLLLVSLTTWPFTALGGEWPGWRGPGGNEICQEKRLPLRWSTDGDIFIRTDKHLYQYLPKSSQPAKIFLTTDGHGLTRMKSGFLLSVSIRVHPWLDHLGCGFAALRCIDERNGISKIPAGRAGLGGADGAALRARAAVLTVPLRCDILSP